MPRIANGTERYEYLDGCRNIRSYTRGFLIYTDLLRLTNNDDLPLKIMISFFIIIPLKKEEALNKHSVNVVFEPIYFVFVLKYYFLGNSNTN